MSVSRFEEQFNNVCILPGYDAEGRVDKMQKFIVYFLKEANGHRQVTEDRHISSLQNCRIFQKVLNHFIKNEKLSVSNINSVLEKMYIFFRYYNNNYRPIYHLESIVYYLIKIVHEL